MPIVRLFRQAVFVAGFALVAWGSCAGAGQPCSTGWLPGERQDEPPDIDLVEPLPGGGNIVVGDSLATSDGASLDTVYLWDASGWRALGGQVTGSVNAVLPLADGRIVIGGGFSRVGSLYTPNIAIWDGTAWAALGPGLPGAVQALGQTAAGEVVASYRVSVPGVFNPQSAVAQWNGTAWVPLGGLFPGKLYTFVTTSQGELLGGGEFNPTGGTANPGVYRWTGTDWVPFGSGVTYIRKLIRRGSTVISAGSAVRQWNGTAWTQLGQSSFLAFDIAAAPDGTLYAFDGALLRRMDGDQWISLPGVISKDYNFYEGSVRLTVLADGSPVMWGLFRGLGGSPNRGAGRWNGTEWGPLTSCTNGIIRAIVKPASGGVYAGGSFTQIGGVFAKRVARWDGARWRSLGDGVIGPVSAMTEVPGGDLVAVGSAIPVLSYESSLPGWVARWNGVTWSALTPPLDFLPTAVVVDTDNQIIVAGNRAGGGGVVARVLDGRADVLTQSDRTITSLLALPNGEVVAGGSFTTFNGQPISVLAQGRGTQWRPFGSGLTGIVNAMIRLQNGDICVAGTLTSQGSFSFSGVAKWDGSTWTQVGGTLLNYLWALAGDTMDTLVVGGRATLFAPSNIYQLRGQQWQALSTLTVSPRAETDVFALARLPSGEIIAGGAFDTANAVPSANFARYLDTGVPWAVAPSPEAALGCGRSITLSMRPATGYADVAVTWLRDGLAIDLADPRVLVTTGAGVSTLTITAARDEDSGDYAVRTSNACGSSESPALRVEIVCPCNPADLTAIGGSAMNPLAPDGQLTVDDVITFVNTFGDSIDCPGPSAPQGPACNVADLTDVGDTGSGPDGQLTVDDALAFLGAFAEGC